MYDFLVIGGGISGASAAYELSAIGSVALWLMAQYQSAGLFELALSLVLSEELA